MSKLKSKQQESSGLCQWNDHGETCKHRGILSPANLGDGPWYCRQHFYKLRGYPDMEIEGLRLIQGQPGDSVVRRTLVGNQLPKIPLHSFAVDEIHKRISAHHEKQREPGQEG